jgi:hypothetical protein
VDIVGTRPLQASAAHPSFDLNTMMALCVEAPLPTMLRVLKS